MSGNPISWNNLALNIRKNFPFLLGNKIDLDERRSVDESTARNYAKDNNLIFYETSAVNGHNIEEAIREISDKASEMDSAPIFNTQMLNHETIEDAFAGDDPATADSSAAGCACQLL